jgi:hypothetical protein
MHQEIMTTSMTTVLLVMIAMATSQGPATAQSSSLQQEAPLQASITVLDAPGASSASLVRSAPLNQEETAECTLRVPDAVSQPSAEGDGATSTATHVSYTPCLIAASSDSFSEPPIRPYSPYTLASAGFEATEAQATDQWPH